MAHTKSALKRVRQSKKRNLRNQAVKSSVRTATRALRESLEQSDAAQIESALRAAKKMLNRAGSKGVLRRKTASRRISRLDRAAARQRAVSGKP